MRGGGATRQWVYRIPENLPAPWSSGSPLEVVPASVDGDTKLVYIQEARVDASGSAAAFVLVLRAPQDFADVSILSGELPGITFQLHKSGGNACTLVFAYMPAVADFESFGVILGSRIESAQQMNE